MIKPKELYIKLRDVICQNKGVNKEVKSLDEEYVRGYDNIILPETLDIEQINKLPRDLKAEILCIKEFVGDIRKVGIPQKRSAVFDSRSPVDKTIFATISKYVLPCFCLEGFTHRSGFRLCLLDDEVIWSIPRNLICIIDPTEEFPVSSSFYGRKLDTIDIVRHRPYQGVSCQRVINLRYRYQFGHSDKFQMPINYIREPVILFGDDKVIFRNYGKEFKEDQKSMVIMYDEWMW